MAGYNKSKFGIGRRVPMGVLLTTKLLKGAVGAAEMAAVAGRAVLAGKRAKRRVNAALQMCIRDRFW